MVFSDYLDFGNEISGVKEGIPLWSPFWRKRGTADGKECGDSWEERKRPGGRVCCEVVYAGRYWWIRVYFGSLGEGIPLWSPFWRKRGTADKRKKGWRASVLTVWYLPCNRFEPCTKTEAAGGLSPLTKGDHRGIKKTQLPDMRITVLSFTYTAGLHGFFVEAIPVAAQRFALHTPYDRRMPLPA